MIIFKPKIHIFLAVFLFVFLFCCGTAAAANYTVGPGSTYKYHTINDAVAVANDGDNIKVYPNNGIYGENLEISHKINLTAMGKVEIDPASNLDAIRVVSGGSGSTIQGFTITTAHDIDINTQNDLTGIELLQASNCKILKNNITGFYIGIGSYSGSNNMISYNNIRSLSDSNGYTTGIDDQDTSDQIIKNTITVKGALNGGAGGIYTGISNKVIDNIITVTHTETGYANGIYVVGGRSNNLISGNVIKISIPDTSYGAGIVNIQKGNNNQFIRNTIESSSNSVVGFQINDLTSGIKIIGNNIKVARIGIYCLSNGVIAQFNRIIVPTNFMAINYTSNVGSLDARYNWYGSNANPKNKISGNVNYSPWLILTITPNPNKINTRSKSTITADLKHDSSSGHPIHNSTFVINGIPFNFSGVSLGIIKPVSATTVNGAVKTIFTAGHTIGIGKVSVKVDNQIITTHIQIIDTIPPKIISTSPKNGAKGISKTSIISVKFSENIKASIYSNKITIKNLNTGKTVSISKSISGTTLNIKTTATRTANTWYLVTIPKSAIKDFAGNNLAATYTFKFKTGI